MSDYVPNPDRDPRNDPRYDDPAESSGRGVTLVMGILVAIALVAGLLFFTGRSDRVEQAQLPPAQDRPMTAPAAPIDRPAPATPPGGPATPPAAAPQ
ncbi:MAG: hypothetical protein ACOY4R_17815 [Pseudomonadota bacterium]